MTISATTVSLSSLQTEIGGSNPISLNEYYTTSAINNGIWTPAVPRSGTISLAQFQGTGDTHGYGGKSSNTDTYNACIGYSVDYFNGALRVTIGYWGNASTSSWTQLTNYTGTAATANYSEIAQFTLTAANANATLYGTGASGYVLHPCNCIYSNPIYYYGNNVNTSGGATGAPGAAWMVAAGWNGTDTVYIYLNPSRNSTGDTGTSISMSNFSYSINAINGGQGEGVAATLTLVR